MYDICGMHFQFTSLLLCHCPYEIFLPFSEIWPAKSQILETETGCCIEWPNRISEWGQMRLGKLNGKNDVDHPSLGDCQWSHAKRVHQSWCQIYSQHSAPCLVTNSNICVPVTFTGNKYESIDVNGCCH